VLLAEDNAVNQKLAVRMLTKLGCRVDTVGNGSEAVVALQHIAYDLVFMDCQMPEMDGYAATTAIRTSEAAGNGHMPIIAMTANAMPGDRERCLAAGMDDYVTKPLKESVLSEVLQKWLQPSMKIPHCGETAVVHIDPPISQPPAPVFDVQAFRGLKDLCDDDNAFLMTLIEAFMEDAGTRMTTLQTAVSTGNATLLERTAHTLKSSSAYIGAVGMAELCERLQTLGKAGDLAAAAPLVTQLQGQFIQVQQILQQENAALQL
jgi:CheY-like chemotaxis protein/HPt (histidine-containing phosphotransfer) domain-containing protein